MNSFNIINPSTNEVVAHRQFADSATIEKTLNDSKSAFNEWRHSRIEERAEICRKLVQHFQDNINSFSKEITLQMGRPIQYSPLEIKAGFKERAEYMINIAAESMADTEAPSKVGFKRFIRKEPLGTILVLAPWNYPYLTSVNRPSKINDDNIVKHTPEIKPPLNSFVFFIFYPLIIYIFHKHTQ